VCGGSALENGKWKIGNGCLRRRRCLCAYNTQPMEGKMSTVGQHQHIDEKRGKAGRSPTPRRNRLK